MSRRPYGDEVLDYDKLEAENVRLEAALAEAVELLRGLWVADSDGVEGVAIRTFLDKHDKEEQ